MDKQTLSNYGWIVICILVLCVMIALATPFGNFIASGVKSTTVGFFDVNQKAVNNVGFGQIPDQSFEDSYNGNGSAKTVNEYGFYFGVPYIWTSSFGSTMTFVFLEDGSLIGYQNAGEYYDVTTASYGPLSFTMQDSTFNFASDGLSFSIPLGTFVADLTSDYIHQP